MTQRQVDKVMKLRANKKRSAAALEQQQEHSDEESAASKAKNAGAQFGRDGKKGKNG